MNDLRPGTAMLRRSLRAALLAGLAVVLISVAKIAFDGLTARARPADLAIVLGNQVMPDGRPTRRLAARLDAALDLYRRGLVRELFVSGGMGVEGHDEATVMKAYLVRRGVPSTAVYADSKGANTRLTCQNARLYMTSHGWRTANVVSQWFHLTRIRLASRSAGITVVGAAAPRYFEWRDLYALAREVVGLYAYALGFRNG